MQKLLQNSVCLDVSSFKSLSIYKIWIIFRKYLFSEKNKQQIFAIQLNLKKKFVAVVSLLCLIIINVSVVNLAAAIRATTKKCFSQVILLRILYVLFYGDFTGRVK